MTRASDTAKLLGAGATILDGTTISTADNTTQLSLTSTDADANAGPVLELYRNSSSPADDDVLGEIEFHGENDADEKIQYGLIAAKLQDASDGTEDVRLSFKTITAGTERERITIQPTETVLNEDSVDLDFRVESNGNVNTLFIEGSSDNISIGHGSPTFASGKGVHLADFYFIGFGNGNGTRPDFQLGQDTSTNTLAFRCGTGADTIDLSINTSGVFSGDFSDTSDERLKENIKDIVDNQIDIIKKLRPVTFDWKEEGKGSDTGFIAQEVKLLLPNDVHTATGKDDDSQLGINSLGLIATLTKALQEAITKIETLEAKVTALES